MATDQSISPHITAAKYRIAILEKDVSSLELTLSVLQMKSIKNIGLGISIGDDTVYTCALQQLDPVVLSYANMMVSANLERINMLLRFAKEDLQKLERDLARL